MNKKLTIVALSLVSMCSIAAVTVSTVAWFYSGTHISFGNDPGNVDVTGGSAASYYESGSGASNDPYVISNKIHLYNLAWLQYIGYYNAYSSFHDSQNDILQNYYVIKNDIDMGGLVLPPIGTEKYPFLGNFNGQNHTISNFTISNDDPTSNNSDFGVAKPVNLYAGEQPDVVGFFGVVGKLPSQSITYDTSIVGFSNVTLSDFTVKAKTSQVLIGLAAGYVDGTVSNVKISGTSTLDVDGQTSTAKSSITNKLSDYGLIGYSTRTGASGSFLQKLSEYYSNGDPGHGEEGDDWGGSINPKNYGRLIYDSFKKAGTGNNGLAEDTSTMSSSISTVNTKTTSDYKLAFSTTARTWVNNAKTYYSPYLDPDYFDMPQDGKPIVNQAQQGTVVYHLKDTCYLPLKFNEDKTGTASDNTGYIVGGTSGNAGVVKVASYYPSSIVNSLSNTNVATIGNAVADKTTTYVDSNLELITYNMKDSAWYRVGDSHNANRSGGETTNSYISGFSRKTPEYLGFEKYDDSRNKLQNILENSTKVQGIHFDFTEVSSSNKLTVASNIKLSGNTYNSSYELLKGSINFNLKSTGYINFFAGTYYSSTMYNFGFFTLNHVSRSGGTITGVKKISQIYQNKYWNQGALSSAATNPKFFYKYSDGTFSNIVVSGATRAATLADRDTTKGSDGMVFNNATILEGVVGTSGTILRQSINNVMFYFEVPVNDGEYAMGMPPTPSGVSSYTGAYLIYLDIGANGDTIDKDAVNARYIITKKGGNSYPLGVDFTPITVSGNGGDTIAISIPSSGKGKVIFAVTSRNISVTDSSSIASYAYRSGNYESSSSGNVNKFTCNLSGDPPGLAAGGERVLTIGLMTTSTDEYTIRVTDQLTDDNGTFNEANSTFEIDSGSGFSLTNKAAIEALTEEINISAFRGLTIAATLTRSNAVSGEFVVTYDQENSNYENKIVDVDIERNGCTISIGVTANYTFKIGGVSYLDGSSYPAS